MTKDDLYLLKVILLNSNHLGNGDSVGGDGYIAALQPAAVMVLIVLEPPPIAMVIETHQ
jgi:hypothetical protein